MSMVEQKIPDTNEATLVAIDDYWCRLGVSKLREAHHALLHRQFSVVKRKRSEAEACFAQSDRHEDLSFMYDLF